MILRIMIAVVACFAGGWMIFDGIHVLMRGKYFGPEKPGPWSIVFIRAGVDPFRLGPLFITLGVAWLMCLIALLTGARWGWYGMLVVAVGSLWYLPLGTMLSIVSLVMLLFGRNQLLQP